MTTYMQFFCKNTECNNAWLDEDGGNWKEPQKWKYCPSCVAHYGYKNSTSKPTSEGIKKSLVLARSKKTSEVLFQSTV